MSDPAPRLGHRNEARRADVWKSRRSRRVLVVVFTVAAVGSVVLVGVDLVVGRPAAGDLFVAFLNALAAVVLWRLWLKRRGHDEGPAH
ncbi:hypothetical protein [Arthrobacter sp. 135MFCol5.1]|uniref:hypothetical protein n=1 Tax=Arthrobacter sp. 135MFCol5.1 TaxID=1158050 RepID=UPI0003A5F3C2|nr:hypothetical protein [Arthrobacter sp. 135MFCol5.1]